MKSQRRRNPKWKSKKHKENEPLREDEIEKEEFIIEEQEEKEKENEEIIIKEIFRKKKR